MANRREVSIAEEEMREIMRGIQNASSEKPKEIKKHEVFKNYHVKSSTNRRIIIYPNVSVQEKSLPKTNSSPRIISEVDKLFERGILRTRR